MPIAWFCSEFGDRRYLRIILGVVAIAMSIGVAYVVGHLSQLSYNYSYGDATRELVDTAVHEIEDGNLDRVMNVLRRVKLDYRPTYQNRANYDEIVRDAVEQMKLEDPSSDEKWTPSPFGYDTWIGHWENDTGYWIVINDGFGGDPFDIRRSGDNVPSMNNVSISDDFRVMKFDESGHWHHELRLVNKYEAHHVWRHADTGKVWQSEPLHKLIRSTHDQRQFTLQTPAE